MGGVATMDVVDTTDGPATVDADPWRPPIMVPRVAAVASTAVEVAVSMAVVAGVVSMAAVVATVVDIADCPEF
jgi:hypothetical protein